MIERKGEVNIDTSIANDHMMRKRKIPHQSRAYETIHVDYIVLKYNI